jgi:hypothetical protein
MSLRLPAMVISLAGYGVVGLLVDQRVDDLLAVGIGHDNSHTEHTGLPLSTIEPALQPAEIKSALSKKTSISVQREPAGTCSMACCCCSCRTPVL